VYVCARLCFYSYLCMFIFTCISQAKRSSTLPHSLSKSWKAPVITPVVVQCLLPLVGWLKIPTSETIPLKFFLLYAYSNVMIFMTFMIFMFHSASCETSWIQDFLSVGVISLPIPSRPGRPEPRGTKKKNSLQILGRCHQHSVKAHAPTIPQHKIMTGYDM